jgi:hypothetical protein
MRRSTKAANYRTTLRLETLESRNVLSASGGFAMALAVPTSLQASTSSVAEVVQTGSSNSGVNVNACVQLANSNDFPEAITCEAPAVTTAIVVADVPTAPGTNPGTVVDLPTEVVRMPQSPIPDGIIQRSDRPFPPLVLIANSDSAGTSGANPIVETPITEFSCRVAIKLLRPESAAESQAAHIAVGAPPINCVTNLGTGFPTPLIVRINQAPANTAIANSVPVATPSRGRAPYRAEIRVAQPLLNSTVTNSSAREPAVTASFSQPVGCKPRRR